MEIYQIKQNKKQFLKLLLLADEQESMIDRYLSRGTLYALMIKALRLSVLSPTKETALQKSKILR